MPSHVFKKVEGLSVCLAVPDEEHLELFLKIQNEEETRQNFVRYTPLGRKQEREWIDKANTTPHDIVFVITTYPALKAIGSIGLHRIHWKDRRAELGIGILPEYCSHGHGTHASMIVLAYAFNELALNKVTWNAIGHNERSIACAKKCGAEFVGRSKRHIVRNGEWHDQVTLDIHVDAWRTLWAKLKKKVEKKLREHP